MAKKNLNPEDSHLFRETVGKVKPIKSDRMNFEPHQKPKPHPRHQVVNYDEHLLGFFSEHYGEKLGIEDSLAFLMPGLQKNVLSKLRNGHYGLDAEIDLHGLTSREAKRQLLMFLHDCVEDGSRCIHIVHGKGFRSPDNVSVLKNNLNSWLRQHKDVQAFCSASPKAGGTGAIFVLLQLSEKYRQESKDS